MEFPDLENLSAFNVTLENSLLNILEKMKRFLCYIVDTKSLFSTFCSTSNPYGTATLATSRLHTE